MIAGSEEESIQERQENEFHVLQAIFAEEIRDVRSTSNTRKVWSPLEIVITLTPQGSMNPKANHVKVDLHIKCSPSYPEKIPSIELENAHGLSKVKLSELRIELQNLARKLVGEVMILELAQHVQRYLHRHNEPRFQSFYEEMMSNKKQQMETQQMEFQKQQDLMRQKEERQRKAIDDEIQKKQDALKEEARLRREMAKRRMSVNDTNSEGNRRHTNSMSTCSGSSQDANSCKHDTTSTCKFRSNGDRLIQRGRCLGHSLRGSVTYVGVDTVTGDVVTVTEWVLRWDCSKLSALEWESVQNEMRNTMKLLSGIGRELSSLYKLNHKNVVNYLDVNYFQENGRIVVQLLQEFVFGVTASCFLSENIPLDYAMLRHVTCGVVEGLAYLHQNHVVHRDLRDSCVYLETTGGVKVSDYCVDARLAELYNCVNKDTVTITEDLPSPLNGKYGKKEDILKLGLLVLSLAQGEIVTDPKRRVASSMPHELRDFIDKCLAEDEDKRWASAALLDHEFIRCPLGRHPQSPAKDKFNLEERRELQPEEDGSDIANLLVDVAESSRLQSEFKVLKWLGRGAFGDVLMVHNKLDGGIYAIKRIILNPHNKQLNRKITREVKLLSRLNHENVVRYFNSWIESSVIDSKHSVGLKSPVNIVTTEVDGPVNGMDWKMPFKDEMQHGESSSSSTDETLSKTPFLGSDSSDDIVFEGGSNEEADDFSESPKSTDYASKTEKSSKTIIQVMFIQMEFCEKSTLRNAIDTGLYRDQERMWRLFREIVEGLSHIHQQGMIHRDLKPVNIFLDSSDHVKIGDFGLATTSKVAGVTKVCERTVVDGCNASQNSATGEGSMTGGVGTTLYVAPELQKMSTNLTYNQKVDIYSLGIIFFEMCTRPLLTGMERVKVINDIRSVDILLPSDFDEAGVNVAQAKLVRWLLDHDPCKRPTSVELLQSDLLPPQMEETELHEMLRHTISNSQSKAFKHMVSSLLKQDVPTAADITYNIDLRKCGFQEKAYLAHDFVCSSLIKLFKLHGAVPVHTPLLMPKNPLYKNNEYCVNLIDHGGGVVSLPYDLRVPLARLVARCHVTNLKRYCIAPVYRERKVFGCQPRQFAECAFDIVTPTSAGLVPDAEVLVVVGEVLEDFAALSDKNRFIRVNHTSVLKAVLMYCGIDEEKHAAVYNILGDAKAINLTRFQVQTQLMSLCLAEHSVSTLYRFLQVEASIKKVCEELKPITKKRNHAASLAQQGLHEIEVLVQQAEALGLRLPVVVCLGLMFNVDYYSGIFFQVVCETTNKRRKGSKLEVVAAGGRYDHLISTFLINPSQTESKESCPRAVGVSFAVEKMVALIMEAAEFQVPGAYSVLICSVGYVSSTREMFQVAQDLWSAGIRARLQYNVTYSLVETQEQCHAMSIPHIVIVKDGDIGFVRVQSFERNVFVEKKVSNSELTEHLLRLLSAKCEPQEHPPPQSLPKYDNPRSERTQTSTDVAMASFGNCNISFITVEKLASNAKRRFEAQMMSALSQVVHHFSSKVHVEVLAVELPTAILKTLAVDLEFESEDAFHRSISGIIDKHMRHKKYLTRLLDQIHSLKFEKRKPVLVLYSLSDCTYRVLV